MFKYFIKFNKAKKNVSYIFNDISILYNSEVCESQLNWLIRKWKIVKSKYKKILKAHSVWAHKQIILSNSRIDETFNVLRRKRKDKIKKIKRKSNIFFKNIFLYKKCLKIKKRKITQLNLKKDLFLKIRISIYNSKFSNDTNHLEREIIYLKNNTLYNLEKQIRCLLKVTKINRSCFLINGTCYSMLRDHIFYKNILNLKNKKVGTKYFFIKSLNIRISTIKINLGEIYMYIHEGLCQHPVVFNNMYFMKIINTTIYPKIIYEQQKRRLYCDVCSNSIATDATYKDLHTENYFFFWCKNCYIKFHYKKDGTFQYKEFEHYSYRYI